MSPSLTRSPSPQLKTSPSRNVLHLDELRDYCSGETAVLICGGVGAVSELHRTNWSGAHLVSVNQHAMIIPDLSFVYAHDAQMTQHLINFGVEVPIISYHREHLREIDIHAGICPLVRLSGPEALWVCDWLGFAETWLIGVDAYKDPARDYWHQFQDEAHQKANLKKKTNNRNDFSRWDQIIDKLRHPERVQTFNSDIQKFLDNA